MKGPSNSHLACRTGVGANVIKHFYLKVIINTMEQHIKKCKQLFEYQHLLSLRHIGVNLIKLFRRKFTHNFCKLAHFIIKSNFCCIALEWYSLQKRVCKFTPKKFYEIDSWWSKL